MNRKNVYMYIVSGVFFGLLYSLIPAYINVIFTQKIIEYLLDMRIPNMVTLSLLSMVAIIIAEILNSIYERCIKPEIRIKIHSDTISYVFNKLKNIDHKEINKSRVYNSIKLMENKMFDQRIELYDNIINVILQISVLVTLISFLMTQNILVTVGIVAYSIIINIIGEKLNKKKFDFLSSEQNLLTDKEIITNFYLLPEYAEYIRDANINKKTLNCFYNVCMNIIRNKKIFIKRIFIKNNFLSGGSNTVIGYVSLAAIGYLKIVKNSISTAQFLSYYRAIDVIINGLNFLFNSIVKMRLNLMFFKNECNLPVSDKRDNKKDFKCLELIDINVVIDNKEIINNISMQIKKNDKIALIGKNASGKTTLLKYLSSIYTNTKGCICVDKKESNNIPDACYIPADTIYFNWESSNIIESFIKNSECNRAKEIENILNHKIKSEGETKLLMIIRAFSSANELIVLDEPFANLDKHWVAFVEDLIIKSNKTVIFSTHEMSVLDKCTKIIETKNRTCEMITRC